MMASKDPTKRVASRGGGVPNISRSKLDDMKLHTKLLLIVCLALAPGFILLFLLVKEKQIAIAFNKKEIQGIIAARPLANLMVNVAKGEWRDSSAGLENKKAFETVLAEGRKVSSQVPPEVNFDKHLQRIEQQAARPETLYTSETTKLISKAIRDAADQTNLILDPDLDSYYLMSVSLLDFPEAFELFSNVASRTDNESDGRGLPTAAAFLSNFQGKLHRSIEVSQANTKTDLTRLKKSAEEANMALGTVIDVWNTSGTRDPEKVLSALNALDILWGETLTSLDTIVKKRVASLEQRQSAALISVVLISLISIALAYGISHRISQRTAGLAQLTHQVTDEGTFKESLYKDIERLESQDEIGELAASFGLMRTRLQNFISELRVTGEKLADANATLELRVEERTLQLKERNHELTSLLDKLKKTQDQLVIQEKMASLGALTAGIAHEIKNPLNFVNNFSELSVDLVTELNEYLDLERHPKPEDVRADIQDVMMSLETNLKKITEHGKRADSIVRGMLQHSRGKSGELSKVDINALLEEYVNLAYHGLRAKDPSFNITLKKHYDPSVGEILAVPQDISRVFLNIVNNACYAAYEKRRSLPAEDLFAPTVSASTKDLGDGRIEIRIRDNGTGMSSDVTSKIFEPFYTTKPTGEGTGLGLSLSFDIIVQQHRGELRVESRESEFAEFIIVLPKVQTTDSGFREGSAA
jgi:signal transduction histidine kinase